MRWSNSRREAVEGVVDIGGGVAPGDDVDAELGASRRSSANCWSGGVFFFITVEGKGFFAFAEHAVTLEAEDEDVDFG